MFVGLIVASNIISIPVKATPLEPDWMNGDLIVKRSDTSYSTSGCVDEVRQLKTNPTFYYKAEDMAPKTWCIYHYKSFDITFYHRWSSSVFVDAMDTFGLYPREESGMAISFDGGQLVPVENVGYDFGNHLAFANGLSRVWYTGNCVYMGCKLSVYDFSRENFTSTQYSQNLLFNWSVQDLEYADGSPVIGGGYSVSSNGQWASIFIRNVGLARTNVETLKTEIVHTNATYTVPSYIVSLNPVTAISNDGNYIYVTGAVTEHAIIRYSSGCSAALWKPTDETTGQPTCEARSMAADLVRTIPLTNGTLYLTHIGINSANDHLWVYDEISKWYDVYPGNTQYASKMSYLALGDSYSSGEGDIDQTGSTHYLQFTNVLGNYPAGIPRELCHLSDRSYPFLLAKDMQLSRGNDMQSIACAGAVRNDVLTLGDTSLGRGATYPGQSVILHDSGSLDTYSGPRLAGLSNMSELQDEAEQNFIPGRVQQVEMVRKYQPKVVTVGVSGNDIGFGPILAECLLGSGVATGQDCSWAQPDGLAKLGRVIKENYKNQLNFYLELKQASPGTDFYAVGYPQFISNNSVFCAELAGSLTLNERTMIRNAVTYLNQTIKNAAAAAGIKYIDIENVITDQSQDLCSKSGMITGPTDKFYYGGLTSMYRDFQAVPTKDNESVLESYILSGATNSVAATLANPMTSLMLLMQEAFHPNAEGHKAIYDYIHEHQNGTSLLDDKCDGTVIICPTEGNSFEPVTPGYFGQTDVNVEFTKLLRVDTSTGKQYLQVSGLSQVERGKTLDVYMKESAYNPGTALTVELHSEPVVLASPASGTSGEVSASVTVPANTSVGYHELIVTGVGADGRTTEYLETIFVTGPADDIDGDGVKNSMDSCEFIAPSGIDADNDGIDNSCDLTTSSATPTSASSSIILAKAQKRTDGELISWPDYLGSTQGSPLSGLKLNPQQSVRDTRNSNESFKIEDGLALALLLVCLILFYTTARNKYVNTGNK